MDYSEYDRIMYRGIITWTCVGVILLLVSCVCLVYLVKNRSNEKDDKIMFWTILILIIVVILGTVILVSNTVFKAVDDVSNQSYIKIEGTFSIIYDEKTPSRACSIILSDGTRLNTTVYVMDAGEYNGYVIYAKKSEKVLCVKALD